MRETEQYFLRGENFVFRDKKKIQTRTLCPWAALSITNFFAYTMSARHTLLRLKIERNKKHTMSSVVKKMQQAEFRSLMVLKKQGLPVRKR